MIIVHTLDEREKYGGFEQRAGRKLANRLSRRVGDDQ